MLYKEQCGVHANSRDREETVGEDTERPRRNRDEQARSILDSFRVHVPGLSSVRT